MQPEFRDLSPHEHPFPGYQFVRQFDTMIIETPIYLVALMDEIRFAGRSIRVMELRDWSEIQKLPEKLVFNCTGLGAKALFADDELTPLKGQLTILLPQAEVQYATLAVPPEVYMFPRTDGILLGALTKWVHSRSILIWRRSKRFSPAQSFFRPLQEMLNRQWSPHTPS